MAVAALSIVGDNQTLAPVGAFAQGTAPEFVEPPVIESVDGVLETHLVAQPQGYQGPGTYSYGGMVPGPTLRLRRGELLKLKLINHLSEDPEDVTSGTNLHVHGLHVSPLGRGDNIFVHVMPGAERDYEYRIPENHQAGLFWYHPHPHLLSDPQVKGGMAGAIIIEGDLDELPQTKGVEERLLVLQGPFAPGINSGIVVNGVTIPRIGGRQGEWQRWRILNATANDFMNLHLEGHPFHRISVDGNYLPMVDETDGLLLAPAERAEVLIQAGPARDEGYALRSMAWEGSPGEFTLAIFNVEAGDEAGGPATPVAQTLVPTTDLRDVQIAERREITFRSGFKISHSPQDTSGELYDPRRVDQVANLGATEEWVIRNDTDFWHPFHIHVNDFQVISSSHPDQLEPFVYYKDTMPLPPRRDGEPGEVVVRIPFIDFTGRFVFHCHILSHEDRGMMGVVEVVQPVTILPGGAEPSRVEIVAETTVRWTNEDGGPHTVTADDESFNSGPLDPGDTFSHTFILPGIASYHCAFHPAVQASVVVS